MKPHLLKLLLFLVFLTVSTAPAFSQAVFSSVGVMIPHIDVGGDPNGLNYVTVVQAVNDNSADTNGHLQLFSDSGAPLSASFNGQAVQSTFDFTVPSGATMQFQIALNGAAVTPGWMQITYTPSDAQTTVLIQYRQGTSVITEVGVNPAFNLLRSTDFPVETDTNLDIGIAVANPTTASQIILARLWDPSSGSQLSSNTITLAAGAHTGKLLSELFSSVSGINQMRAQVSLDSCTTTACTANNGFTFIATALRINRASNTFTAVPIIPRQTGGALVRTLPQIVVGGDPGSVNFQTILYLSTVSPGGVSGVVDVLSDSGNTIPVTANGSATSGHFNFSVFTNEVMKIVLSSSSTLQAGWVRFTLPSSVPLVVNAVFQTYNGSALQSEASVLESLVDTEALVYVSSAPNIGVALINPQPVANTINVTLYNNAGFVAATSSVTLQPFGHLARFVSELFPQYATATDWNGSLSMQSDSAFSAVALRLTGPNIAALPVADTVLFRPAITNLRVTSSARTTGQVSFTVDVRDFNSDLVTSTSTAVFATMGVLYVTQNAFDGYYTVPLDGTATLNMMTGTLTGTFQGQATNIPSGTSAAFYIVVQDSLGNYSNLVNVPFKF
jgi:hypothetical protein